MILLARLAVAAVVLAYGEVLLGSWTRINGAGMTCPDYPLCHGDILPPLTGGTVWEWSHRLTAALLSLLVIAVIAAAWRQRRHARFAGPAAAMISFLFVFQVFLGAATVHLANTPVSVVWHWGTAMAFVASLAVVAIFAFTAARPRPLPSGRRARVVLGLQVITAVIAFATMCVGAYVSSSGAGLACTAITSCAGNVVVYTSGQEVQMLHRFAATICLLSGAISFAAVWALGASRRVRIAASAGIALLFVQILLGLLNIVLRLPIDLREAHAANAALLFLAFVCAAAFAMLDGADVKIERYARAR